ncbi:MAG: hypothetical protein IT293_11045 [Deltaproteobacteria bacterium]|nr:hypothetical protein [Deltaproteobacteria bacterium]
MVLKMCRVREKRNSGVSGGQDEIFSERALKPASMAGERTSAVVRDAQCAVRALSGS